MTEWVVVACLMVAVVRAYPTGPPISTDQTLCQSMFPTGHNVTEKTTPPPYEIIVDTNNCYTDGMDIMVSAMTKSGSNMEIEGLLMLARPQNVNDDAVGTWSTMSSNIGSFRTDSCFGKTANAISQKKELESKCEAVYWRAPANFTQTVEFVATIVEDTDVFWINVKSPLIQYKATCTGTAVKCVPNPASPTQAPAQNPNSAGMPVLHVTAMLTTLLMCLTSLQ